MVDPVELKYPAEPEDVIKWLVSDNVSLREGANKYLFEHWDIQFREYLWKAIEDETRKSLQAAMVKVALSHLKEKSLRKMIRFLEKGQLYTVSRNQILDVYFYHEDEEIRIALLKSLRREESQTYTFVFSLVKHRLAQLKSSEFLEFLSAITQPDIPHREEFVIALFQSYFSQTRMRDIIAEFELWDLISEDGKLLALVIDTFFNETTKSTSKLTKKINTQRLLWTNFKWLVNCPHGTNCMKDRFGFHEKIVIQALSHRTPLPRFQAIKVLGQQVLQNPYPEDERKHRTYVQNLNQLWTDLILYDVDEQLLNIEDSFFEHISDLIEGHNHDGEELHPFSDLQLLKKLQDMQIYPATLAELILAHLPRKYLITMIENDPNRENRLQAYQELCNPLFWHNEQNIGPPHLWIKTISRTIRSLQYESGNDMLYVNLKLLQMLLQLLNERTDPVTEVVLDNLPSILPLLTDLPETLPVALAKNSINQILGGELVILPQVNIPPFARKDIIGQLFSNIHSPIFLESIVNLAEINPLEFHLEVMKAIDTMIHSNHFDSTDSEVISQILQQFKLHEDVRIRTKAEFYNQKIKSDFSKIDES